jgi:cytochrome bd-type quinol oxidase subunit 2
MGMSLAFHIIFAVVGIGMPALMVIAESRWLRTGDAHYLELAKRWVMNRWAIPFHLATGAAAVAAIAALIRRAYHAARVAAALQVILILSGWAISQYPFIVPPDLTIRSTAAPRGTLVLILAALAAGALVLFPSLAYLFRVFKSKNAVAVQR